MPGLLILDPSGGEKLYKDVEDNLVDSTTQTFDWEWIQKATLLRDKSSFMAHVKKNHFGFVEQVGAKKFRIAEGHRAICYFNNRRYTDQKTAVVTREQYEDMMQDRPIRKMVVTVQGRPCNKRVSLKRYNHSDFIAVSRYSSDKAMVLAVERVGNDIKSKSVRWHSLDRDSDEFQRRYNERVMMFRTLYSSEKVLVAKNTASDEEIRQSVDLPAGVLDLIDYKLTITQAEYYISRVIEFRHLAEAFMDNPVLSYRVHQIVLEELRIEHFRDLQRLYGDNIDKPTEDALGKALRQHSSLIKDLMKSITPNKSKPENDALERGTPQMPSTEDPFA